MQYSARSAWLSVRLCKWPCPKYFATRRIAAVYGWFNVIRQVTATCPPIPYESTLAPPGEYDWTCASFGPPQSTTETANGSVQHSLRQKVPILYNGRAYPPELPLPMGDGPAVHVTQCFRPMRAHNPNGTSIGSAVFAQMTTECYYTGLPVAHVGIWTSCNTWFIGPTRVRNANCKLIVAAVFAGLTSVTHWQSDRKTDRPR